MNRNQSLPPAVTGRIPQKYPWLSEDKFCDVCVVGGGLTGALCALAAAQSGLETVLITAGCAGFGGTAYSSGAAEYDGGRTLTGLDRSMEISDALKLLELGTDALDDLENLCGRLDGQYGGQDAATGFERRDSLLFTSQPSDTPLLETEYLARRERLPGCTLLSRKTAADAFAFDCAGGILSKGGGAVLDAYALTQLCLKDASRHGAEIFEHTAAEDIQLPKHDGSVTVAVSTQRVIYAGKLILATGGDGISTLPCRSVRRREFTVICRAGRPGHPAGWAGRCLLRGFGSGIGCCIRPDGSAAAYAGYRANRLPLPFGRGRDGGAEHSRLTRRLREVLPEESECRPVSAFSMEYDTPADGLPVAGTHENYKGCVFALCAGYSAPVYAMMTASAAIAALKGYNHPGYAPFSPSRLF